MFFNLPYIPQKFLANFFKLTENNSIWKNDIIFEWAEFLAEELKTLITIIYL